MGAQAGQAQQWAKLANLIVLSSVVWTTLSPHSPLTSRLSPAAMHWLLFPQQEKGGASPFPPPHTTSLALPQACSCTTATAVSLLRTFSSAHGPGARTGQHSSSSVLSHLLVFWELLSSSCPSEEGTEEPRE